MVFWLDLNYHCYSTNFCLVFDWKITDFESLDSPKYPFWVWIPPISVAISFLRLLLYSLRLSFFFIKNLCLMQPLLYFLWLFLTQFGCLNSYFHWDSLRFKSLRWNLSGQHFRVDLTQLFPVDKGDFHFDCVPLSKNSYSDHLLSRYHSAIYFAGTIHTIWWLLT